MEQACHEESSTASLDLRTGPNALLREVNYIQMASPRTSVFGRVHMQPPVKKMKTRM